MKNTTDKQPPKKRLSIQLDADQEWILADANALADARNITLRALVLESLRAVVKAGQADIAARNQFRARMRNRMDAAKMRWSVRTDSFCIGPEKRKSEGP